jgi:hypothetical protein
MGLEKPLFELKNSEAISIPPGLLAFPNGSLLLRDRRAEELRREVHAQQDTGVSMSNATAY